MNPIPTDSEYGRGERSVNMPTIGCSSEAVIWYVKVRSPIWPKLSW